MAPLTEKIRNLIENGGEEMSRQEFDELRAEYPYFIASHILYLQRNRGKLNINEKEEVLAALALAYPDHSALYDVVGEDADKYKNFYPQQEAPATPDTDTTIDTFLDQYGGNDEKELQLLDRMIFNPVPLDYSQVLEEQQRKEDSGKELPDDPIAQAARAIDDILERSKPVLAEEEQRQQEPEPVKGPEESDDTMLSESLAKIFIKQGKYSKALEIIRNISLKFPEKSIYFADQIRFLQKLILTEQINKR